MCPAMGFSRSDLLKLMTAFTPPPSVKTNHSFFHRSAIFAYGAASYVVNLVQPNSLFLDYQNRLDLRVGKTFRFGQTKIQGFADVFNVLNAGTALTVNQTYAAAGTNAWLTPTTIMDGRYVRFGVQMSF